MGQGEGSGALARARPHPTPFPLSPPPPLTVDYQNRRPEFIGVFIDSLINWDKVAERFAAAGGK